MFKTLVTPENNDLHLSIPDSYIGKEIEVLIYAKDEVVAYKSKQEMTMADFSGIL
jgi:putative transposon-encoded protein